MNGTKTVADVLLKIENDLFDTNYSLQKLKFLAEELCDITSPAESGKSVDDIKTYFYVSRKKIEMLAALMLDYACSTQKSTDELMRYADMERDKYIEQQESRAGKAQENK